MAVARITALREVGMWPPVVPSPVLVESLAGHAGCDANANRFLKMCLVEEQVSVAIARRAAALRARARRGSAVDAIVVAMAESDGIVLTQDLTDLRALAARADGVAVQQI